MKLILKKESKNARHIQIYSISSVLLNQKRPVSSPQILSHIKDNRHFLYARYDVELTNEALADIGLTDIDARKLAAMDAVEHIEDFKRIGETVGKEVDVTKHFGKFAKMENFWP